MKEETGRKWTLWLIILLVVATLTVIVLTGENSEVLLASGFSENPKAFIAAWALAIILVICAVGFARASIKMLEEVKEEVDKRSKK